MTEEHREEIIATLILWTGWAKEAFEKMSDREIAELHDKRVGG